MSEYKYVDLPQARVDIKQVPATVTTELNALVEAGWAVEEMISSTVSGKVGFLLSRDA